MLLKQFKVENICNTDETKLLHQCSLNRINVFKNNKCSDNRPSRKRLIKLVAANVGGQKLPPLAIGKSANPKKTLRNCQCTINPKIKLG